MVVPLAAAFRTPLRRRRRAAKKPEGTGTEMTVVFLSCQSSCAAPSRMNLPVQFSTKFELVVDLKSNDVPIKL